ncbi:MAG TPA: ATP-binding protein [Candidatus Acidoferrum sp.]|nr:ATP-binding protein [Candidatus Acidoferrum sp.]
MAEPGPCPALPSEPLSLRERLTVRLTQARDHAAAAAARLSLHNKFWLSFAVVTIAMTACTLFAVHEVIQVRAEREIEHDARTSVLTFQVLSQQQQEVLSRKADLLATLAVLREGDITTVQDVGNDPWQSSDGDLLAITDRHGHITALQTRNAETLPPAAKEVLASFVRSVDSPGASPTKKQGPFWWTIGPRFYQLAIHPYYQDPPANRVPAGNVIVGREFDATRAKELARILGSDVALRQGSRVLASSLSPFEEQEVSERLRNPAGESQLQLGEKRFFTSTVDLAKGSLSSANIVLLRSDDAALASIFRLNLILIALGITAVLVGGALVFFMSGTFTRPLGALLEGVRALEQGDYTFPLAPAGSDELARVTRAFDSMRSTLQRNEAERKQLETDLRQSQKMDALGRLAGGVAHDFNNLLTVIKGNADLALDQIKPADPVRANCEQIGKVADRASSLTRQLLAFSRSQLLQPKVLDLNDLVMDSTRLLKRLLREDIEFNVSLGESLGRVLADPGQLEQVLLNLTVNAADAMPEGGTLLIETHNISVDAKHSLTHPSVNPGNYVLLAVTDSGIGMTPEIKARIFEPFFTTKDAGKGTGLGLATVYGIVNQSSGFIHVDSALGDGTRFEIYLPLTHEQLPAASSDLPIATATKHRETVLLVEDEDSVRSLTCEFLQSAGYQVLTASDGVEALEIADRLKGAIHLLVTDVVMPRMRGPELARRVQEKLPKLKVVFMSGYTQELHGSSHPIELGSFLQKPFSRTELLAKLHEALHPESFSEPRRSPRLTPVV